MSARGWDKYWFRSRGAKIIDTENEVSSKTRRTSTVEIKYTISHAFFRVRDLADELDVGEEVNPGPQHLSTANV